MTETRHGGMDPWWRDTVVYQIYPRSFRDSNGDGIGDIPGIISRLDYIRKLGFRTLWISPFFDSPQADFGYDIRDYRAVAPEYGTMEDCEELIRQVHARGMKILFDLVLNHTSETHPWFIESRSSRDNPKRDYYIWRDGRKPGGGAPPNNWKSKVSGSGWHYDAGSGQWYWAAFLPFQPDLNYRNPEVRALMLETVSFWLEKGVDGFRLDIIGSIFEDAEFRDNPPAWNLLPREDNPGMFFRSVTMTENLPETFAFMQELRQLVDRYSDPPRYLVGEVFGSCSVLRSFCGKPETPGLHSVFLFKTLTTPFRAAALHGQIREFEEHFPAPLLPTLVFSNHDVMRRISVLGNSPVRARLNALVQFTLRGIPFTYYGEELGLPQSFFPFGRTLDPIAAMFAFLPVVLQKCLQRLMLGRISRDGCRTPMPWTSRSPGYGFTVSDHPWLPVSAGAASVNAEAEERDQTSLLSFYRSVLAFRAGREQLRAGNLVLPDRRTLPRKVLAFRRTLPGFPTLLVAANFSGRRRRFPVNNGKIVFSTTGRSGAGGPAVLLEPWEGMIVEEET